MNSKTVFIAIAFSMCCLLGCGQVNVSDNFSGTLDDFAETMPPKCGSTEWYALNHSRDSFGVEIVNGQLKISKAKRINENRLKITGGTLVGIDRGEWGGKLAFVPFDTTKKEIEIKEWNVKFIFTFKGGIYFIEGLAHLAISNGALYKLDTVDNKFTYEKVIDFEDAPEAFVIHGDKIFIAASASFYAVRDFKNEIIFKEQFWSCLYPNSIAVIDEKNVFVGISGGIVKLDLTAKTLKFYKYNQ
jgi:hypothetical protein